MTKRKQPRERLLTREEFRAAYLALTPKQMDLMDALIRVFKQASKTKEVRR